MPRATLTLPSAAEHVRTARLVAVAAARRSGFDEEVVDDVRLAVGEAVARAVQRATASRPGSDVDVVIADEGDRFLVEVTDRAGADPDSADPDDALGLSLLAALVPVVEVDGSRVTLVWPRS